MANLIRRAVVGGLMAIAAVVPMGANADPVESGTEPCVAVSDEGSHSGLCAHTATHPESFGGSGNWFVHVTKPDGTERTYGSFKTHTPQIGFSSLIQPGDLVSIDVSGAGSFAFVGTEAP